MIAPWAPTERFRTFDRFNKMMDNLFSGENFRGWFPNVDIKETDKEITFMAELPGMKQADINVDVSGDVLTISGHREFNKEEKKEDYVRVEREYGSFQRAFTLGVPVLREKVTAIYKDGILTVTVPKAEGISSHKVSVKTG